MDKTLYTFIVEKKHHAYRRDFYNKDLCQEFKMQNLDVKERMTRRFEMLTEYEEPIYGRYHGNKY